MVIVVMGVSGAGKSTIGRILAENLGWQFRDADDFHSPANKRKMAAGIALTDADRAPWLAAIRELIEGFLRAGVDAVVACSALKQAYRDQIVGNRAAVKMVYLKGSRELIRSRIANRTSHFMNKDLLDSQFDTLEEPRDGIAVDIAPPPNEIVAEIRRRLGI
ncbi:MAG TPA: gluconokinase [Candidatus Binataceae bacterium]|nr:gluconokinase [Candidatus Binataceae bacterium]